MDSDADTVIIMVIMKTCRLKMNKQTNRKQKQTYKCREQTDGCQREGGRGMIEWVKGRGRYWLPAMA